jgi:hypothetical protein
MPPAMATSRTGEFWWSSCNKLLTRASGFRKAKLNTLPLVSQPGDSRNQSVIPTEAKRSRGTLCLQWLHFRAHSMKPNACFMR